MQDSKEYQELRLRFQTYIDDIRYSKQQQWNILYLTLLAVAGVISLKLTQASSPWLLTVFILVISGLGIYFVGAFHWSMTCYRSKKDAIKEQFSEKEPNLHADEAEPSCCEFLNKDFWRFALWFWFLIGFAAFVAFYVIWDCA